MSDLSRARVLAIAILLAGAALRLYGIADQPLLGDEEQAAASAAHYVESGQFGPTMWYHPNLRNVVIGAVTGTFGPGVVPLRATSLVLGILSIPLLGLLLRLLTGDRTAALLAAALLALEQVHITFSRQAIQETWTTFFFLLGTTAAVAAWRRRAPWLLAASGLAFGLGVSSKFHALLPLAACGAVGLHLAWRDRSVALAGWVVACLALLPATVFLATYLPWFSRGYGIGDFLEMQQVLLAKMASHTGNPMDQTIDTAAWQWFLRPMGYANFVLAGGQPFITIAFSNPVVWLTVLPATAWVARAAFTVRAPTPARAGRFVLLLFAASYLPLALSPRPIWLLSSLAVLPFAFMIVGLAFSWLHRQRPRTIAALSTWAALAAASSLALYPMALGRADPDGLWGPLVERFRPAHERAGVRP